MIREDQPYLKTGCISLPTSCVLKLGAIRCNDKFQAHVSAVK